MRYFKGAGNQAFATNSRILPPHAVEITEDEYNNLVAQNRAKAQMEEEQEKLASQSESTQKKSEEDTNANILEAVKQAISVSKTKEEFAEALFNALKGT
jgi:hypothetical protein